MSSFIPWNSQPLDEWAEKYAEGQFIDLDGHSTHYRVKGDGEPLILIHGFFFDSHMWDTSIDVLAQRYKVYAIDLWGFGYSTRAPLDYGYNLYTEQLLKFMNTLDITQAHLIGQSMGGGTIINFSVLNRDRVNKIVLVNVAGMPNPLPLMARISNLSGVGEFMFGLGSDFMRRFTLGKNFFHNKDLLTEDYYQNIIRFHKIQESSEVMLTVTRSLFFDTLLEEIKTLGQMDLPILIVWGREEKSINPTIAQKLSQILKSSHLEILDEAGHCSHMDQPELFNQLVIDFLAK